MGWIVNYFFLLIVSLLGSSVVHAQIVDVDNDFERAYVSPVAEINNGVIELDDISSATNFVSNKSFSFFYNSNKETRWIKFSVRNTSVISRNLLLEVTNSNLYHARLYEGRPDEIHLVYEFGIKFPYANRPYDHNNFILPIHIDSGLLKTYWLEVYPSDYINNFNLILWDKNKREDFKNSELLFFTIYEIAYFIFLAVLGIVLFVTRQRWQWGLFFYVLIGAICKYVDFGFGFHYFWPNHPQIQLIAPFVLINFHSISSIFFFRRYFDTPNQSIVIDKSFIVLSRVSAALIVIRLLNLMFDIRFMEVMLMVNVIVIFFITLLNVATIIYYLYRKILVSETVWFIFCFSPPILVFFIYIFRLLGLFHVDTIALSKLPIFLESIDIHNLIMWAIIWEMLSVSVLLIFRLDKLFKDNLKMYVTLENQRKESMQALMSSIEGERKRVAQELHDGSGVSLSVIRMKMTHIKDGVCDDSTKEKLALLMNDMDQVSQEIRDISHFIMPISLSKLGLKAGINELLNKVTKAYPNIEFNLFQQYDEGVLSDTQQINIYRICQELINNIIKHANAKCVSLTIVQDDGDLSISIEDDGVGFDIKTQGNGIGIDNMKLRVQLMQGTLEMESNGTSGSFFHIVIPLN